MSDPVEKTTCQTCRYFIRHYVCLTPGLYTPIRQGHCTEPRLKARRDDTPACSHYAPREAERGA